MNQQEQRGTPPQQPGTRASNQRLLGHDLHYETLNNKNTKQNEKNHHSGKEFTALEQPAELYWCVHTKSIKTRRRLPAGRLNIRIAARVQSEEKRELPWLPVVYQLTAFGPASGGADVNLNVSNAFGVNAA